MDGQSIDIPALDAIGFIISFTYPSVIVAATVGIEERRSDTQFRQGAADRAIAARNVDHPRAGAKPLFPVGVHEPPRKYDVPVGLGIDRIWRGVGSFVHFILVAFVGSVRPWTSVVLVVSLYPSDGQYFRALDQEMPPPRPRLRRFEGAYLSG